MKKASTVLLIVGGIIGIFGLVLGILFTYVFFNSSDPNFVNALKESIQKYYPEFTPEQVDQALAQMQEYVQYVAYGCLAFSVATGLSVILGFVNAAVKKTALYISNIVFGLLSANIFALIGGILGLASRNDA